MTRFSYEITIHKAFFEIIAFLFNIIRRSTVEFSCYVLVRSTSTSHLVIASLLSDQASLLSKSQLIFDKSNSLIQRLCSDSQRASHEMSKRSQHESFIKRFTKSLISRYLFHDMKRLKYKSNSISKLLIS